MGEVGALINRNMKKYFRNKGTMVFSLLSAFIVAALYIFFLAQMQIDYVKEAVGDIAGIDTMINTWLVGGLILIPAVSVPLIILCFKVDDVIDGTQKDLMVTPANRFSILLGYVISAFVVSFIMTTICFAMYEVFIVAKGGTLLTFGEIAKVLGMAALVIFSFTGMEFFFISFMKTNSGISVANSLLNVLLGFLLGLYVPIGLLGDGIANVIKSFPLLQSASVIRKIIMKDSLNTVFAGVPDEVILEIRQMYGIDVVIGDTSLSNGWIIAILVIFGIIFYVGSMLIMNFRKAEQ